MTASSPTEADALGRTTGAGPAGRPVHDRLEKILLQVALAILFGLTLTRPLLTLTGAFDHGMTSTARQMAYAGLLALTAITLWTGPGKRQWMVLPLPILLTMGWAGLSLLWSVTPATSLAKWALTAIVVWTCFLCTDRLGARRSIRLIQAMLLITLVVDYATVLVDPWLGIHNYGVDQNNPWRGIMGHKNIAGTVSGITVLMFALYGTVRTRWLRYGVALAALVFLGLTSSRASMIGTALALILAFVLHRHGDAIARKGDQDEATWFRRIGPLAWVAAAILPVLLTLRGDWFVQLVANPALWSNRGEIWQPMVLSYLSHPWSGAGFGAFWSSGDPGAPGMIRDASRWSGVTQGHNGYLDLAVQIGLPGLLIALFAVIAWPLDLLAKAMKADKRTGALCFALLLFFLLNNMAETSLFDGDQVPQVFAMMALGLIAALLRRNGMSARPRAVRRDETVPTIDPILRRRSRNGRATLDRPTRR